MNTTVNRTLPRYASRPWQWLRRLLMMLGIGYIAILGYLIYFETSLVYPVSKYPAGNWTPQNFAFEEVQFMSADQTTKLVGWFLPRPDQQTDDASISEQPLLRETVLLCHGNAENAAQTSAYMGDHFRRHLNADVFVFDYRGYGKSAGAPSEPGILDDVNAALDWLCQRTNLRPDQIIVVGHSIGGGPACQIAATRPCKALILQRTFNSLAETAQANYPFFPVKYLMTNQYDSVTRIKRYNGPVFQSHGTADKLIPIELARKLFESAPTTNKEFLAIEGMGHFDPLPPSYWPRMVTFVKGVGE